MAVAVLKVMKQWCHLPISLSFTFQGSRNEGLKEYLSISQKQWRGCAVGLFTLCGNLPSMCKGVALHSSHIERF